MSLQVPNSSCRSWSCFPPLTATAASPVWNCEEIKRKKLFFTFQPFFVKVQTAFVSRHLATVLWPTVSTRVTSDKSWSVTELQGLVPKSTYGPKLTRTLSLSLSFSHHPFPSSSVCGVSDPFEAKTRHLFWTSRLQVHSPYLSLTRGKTKPALKPMLR